MNEAKEIMSSVQFCFTNNLGRSRPVIVELKTGAIQIRI